MFNYLWGNPNKSKPILTGFTLLDPQNRDHAHFVQAGYAAVLKTFERGEDLEYYLTQDELFQIGQTKKFGELNLSSEIVQRLNAPNN